MAQQGTGEFLAALRKAKGYTQQETADHLGVSNKTISSWETGGSSPDISMLPALAELYGVTCDEIVRGRRITVAEDEKVVIAKREKAIRHILTKKKIDFTIICWICGALTALGLALAMITAYVAGQGMTGFLIGLSLFAVSVIICVPAMKKIRFSLSGEEESAGAAKLANAASKASLRLVMANLVALGLILPQAFSQRYGQIAIKDEIAYGLAAAAILFALSLLIVFPLSIKADASVGHSKRRQKIVPYIVLPAAALILAAGCTACGFAATIPPEDSAPALYRLDESDIDKFMTGDDSPFKEEDHTLIEEEKPAWDGEVGKYETVYLFENFPSRWKEYYHTRETEDGTLVTIYTYRVRKEFTDDTIQWGSSALSVYTCRAFAPALQGGIDRFDIDVTYVNPGMQDSYYIYDYTIKTAGDLRYLRAHYRTNVLIAGEIALAASFAVTLSVGIVCTAKKCKTEGTKNKTA